VAINLYRIAQEAITNAIKHGRAKNILVELSSSGDCSKLTVESDGLGFPQARARSEGMGLKVMNYRAEMIDATLNICTGANGGTIVTCVFPNTKHSQ
jgi:signal transduction histidine kinase